MRVVGMTAAALLLVTGTAWAQGYKPLKKCALDAVIAGTVCMDKYEASVWEVPNPTTTNRGLVIKIQQGKATAALLTAAGAVQRGVAGDDYGASCADDGYNCLQSDALYAVSLPGVMPSSRMTWFQASAFCANSRKRLPTNGEWQVAALDHGGFADADCNISSGARAATGAYGACISEAGAYDTTGNVAEWVADWVPRSTACPEWGSFTNDRMCLSGADTTAPGPGALLRGGHFSFGSLAGPLSVFSDLVPSTSSPGFGFRCVR